MLALAACSPSAEGLGGAPTLTGVVTEVSSEGLEDVTSFELRSEGEMFTIHIADDVDYGFPLSHLNAHRTTGDPVRVETEERDGRLFALSIEDV